VRRGFSIAHGQGSALESRFYHHQPTAAFSSSASSLASRQPIAYSWRRPRRAIRGLGTSVSVGPIAKEYWRRRGVIVRYSCQPRRPLRHLSVTSRTRAQAHNPRSGKNAAFPWPAIPNLRGRQKSSKPSVSSGISNTALSQTPHAGFRFINTSECPTPFVVICRWILGFT